MVQLDGSGRLPAVDASQLTNLPSAGGTPGGADTQLQYNDGGSFAGLSTLTTDGTNITLSGQWTSTLNGAASAPPVSLTGTWFTGGTGTTTKPQFLVEPAGTTSTSWNTNGTGLGVNAPSGFTGNLLDLQVDGTSKLSINNSKIAGTGGYYVTLQGFGQSWLYQLNLGSRLGLGPVFNSDTFLQRDGSSGIIAQLNGTNAQTFRCYGTYTDASNYVRAALSSTSTDVTLAAETAGTGADDIPLNLTAAGTGTVKVNSVAEIAVSSTVAGLPATPAVGMITRVTDGDSGLTFGNTVVNSGAGATPYLVWYNGTNWTILGA